MPLAGNDSVGDRRTEPKTPAEHHRGNWHHLQGIRAGGKGESSEIRALKRDKHTTDLFSVSEEWVEDWAPLGNELAVVREGWVLSLAFPHCPWGTLLSQAEERQTWFREGNEPLQRKKWWEKAKAPSHSKWASKPVCWGNLELSSRKGPQWYGRESPASEKYVKLIQETPDGCEFNVYPKCIGVLYITLGSELEKPKEMIWCLHKE